MANNINIASDVQRVSSPSGASATIAQNLSNQISSEIFFEMLFSNGSGGAQTGLLIIPSCMDATLGKSGVTTTSSVGDSSKTLAYLQNISMNMYGLRLETDDLDVFKGTLVFEETSPSGDVKTVKLPLSRYRVPVGNTFSEMLEIGERDFNIINWAGLSVRFEGTLGASKYVKAYFKVRGWNKSRNLNPLPGEIIL